jgi:hypothetical protein
LLYLLWVLDATVDLLPQVTELFQRVLNSDLFTATDFPMPGDAERRGPRSGAAAADLPLFGVAGIDVDAGESEEE